MICVSLFYLKISITAVHCFHCTDKQIVTLLWKLRHIDVYIHNLDMCNSSTLFSDGVLHTPTVS